VHRLRTAAGARGGRPDAQPPRSARPRLMGSLDPHAVSDTEAETELDPEEQQPEPAPLLDLRDGLPPVVETEEALDETVAAFARGTGPVAIDAERASGYRYS